MAESTEDKGFKFVDKRTMSDEEREAEQKSATIPPPAQVPEGVPPSAGGGVQGERPPVDPNVAPHGQGNDAIPHRHGREAGAPAFLDLLQSLQFSAMMHLGMVQEQDGRRSPVDLPGARDAIDMMDILKEKTKGNLTAEEDEVLTEGLYVLRMSYLAATNAGKPQGGGKS
jgi:hypothetical protein